MATSEGFMPEVQKVVNAHKNDFYYKNYSSKVPSYGAYINNLSPFFKKVRADINAKNNKTIYVEDFQRRCNYVSGLMAIWGFDYNNGKTYHRWGSGVGSTGDAFYTGSKRGGCHSGTIGVLCQGSNGKSRTTCCNYGVDTLLKACGIYKMSCALFKRMVNQGKASIVKNKKNIQVGDIINFFGSSVDSNKKSTWKNWKHVAIVYKKTDKYIVLADYGGRFITTKKPFHYMDRKSVETTGKAGGAYSKYGKNWCALHLYNFKSEPQPEIPITDGEKETFDQLQDQLEGINETTEAISDIPLDLDENVTTEDTPLEDIDYEANPQKIPMPRLEFGSKGKAVKIWQILANEYSPISDRAKIDGDFGTKTKAVSRRFQEKQGMSIDGIIDSKEWELALSLVKGIDTDISQDDQIIEEEGDEEDATMDN